MQNTGDYGQSVYKLRMAYMVFDKKTYLENVNSARLIQINYYN